MSYTLGEAARATGMSKAAISRAIKNGTLSAEKQEDGSFKIDPAELHRVYPPLTSKQATSRNDETVSNGNLNGELRELKTRLEAATQRLADKEAELADVREDRNQWRAQAQKLLLAAPVEEEPKRRRWFSFGKR